MPGEYKGRSSSDAHDQVQHDEGHEHNEGGHGSWVPSTSSPVQGECCAPQFPSQFGRGDFLVVKGDATCITGEGLPPVSINLQGWRGLIGGYRFGSVLLMCQPPGRLLDACLYL
jgi:hypothetical protein